PEGKTPAAFVEHVRRLLSHEPSIASRPTQPALSSIAPVIKAPVRASWRSRLIVLTSVLAIAALAYFIVDRVRIAKNTQASSAAQGISPAVPRESVAVLPFTDLSEKHDQQYFADGMAEDIMNLLARIPELKVIGRTSSFSFRGKDMDVR